jgi:hypothetical protein
MESAMTNTKATPKSCSCQHCRRGKGSSAGRCAMRRDERAFRHAANVRLRLAGADAELLPAPRGGYYD